MPFVLPQVADQQTLSGKFADFYVGATLVMGCTNVRFGMQPSGDFVQCMGEATPRNNPNTTFGAATLQRLTIYQNDLSDILIAAGYVGSTDFSTGTVDLRFIPMPMRLVYGDGIKKMTKTLLRTYIRRVEEDWTGNRLATDTWTMEYVQETDANN